MADFENEMDGIDMAVGIGPLQHASINSLHDNIDSSSGELYLAKCKRIIAFYSRAQKEVNTGAVPVWPSSEPSSFRCHSAFVASTILESMPVFAIACMSRIPETYTVRFWLR